MIYVLERPCQSPDLHPSENSWKYLTTRFSLPNQTKPELFSQEGQRFQPGCAKKLDCCLILSVCFCDVLSERKLNEEQPSLLRVHGKACLLGCIRVKAVTFDPPARPDRVRQFTTVNYNPLLFFEQLVHSSPPADLMLKLNTRQRTEQVLVIAVVSGCKEEKAERLASWYFIIVIWRFSLYSVHFQVVFSHNKAKRNEAKIWIKSIWDTFSGRHQEQINHLCTFFSIF